MAKVIGTIEAQYSGKVGDKVYYKHQGVTCVRKAPILKSDSRTPLQLINQQRFKAIHLSSAWFNTFRVGTTQTNIAVGRD